MVAIAGGKLSFISKGRRNFILKEEPCDTKSWRKEVARGVHAGNGKGDARVNKACRVMLPLPPLFCNPRELGIDYPTVVRGGKTSSKIKSCFTSEKNG